MKVVKATFRDRIEGVGFVQLPLLVLMDSRLDPKGKVVYALLRHYARQGDVCWPGQGTLAADTGLSEKTVRGAVEALERVGLVTHVQVGNTKTNRYWLEPLRSVYGVTNSDELSPEAIKWCRIAVEGEETSEEEPPPSLIRIDTGARLATEVISNAQARSHASAEEKRAKRALSQASQSGARKATVKETRVIRNGYKPAEVQQVWRRAWEDAFLKAPYTPWRAKELKQVGMLVEDYGVEAVKKVLDYIPRQWEKIREWDGVNTPPFPDLTFIVGFRSRIFPAVATGEVFWSTKKSASISRDEYVGRDDDDAEDGYF
jgi:hypothetical protein